MCSFYRRYIPHFSHIVEPLNALTKKHAEFHWSNACQDAFETLKEKLCVPILLNFPDTTKEYLVYTDASDTCIGAVLAQETEDGERPIQYLSHHPSPSQCRWPIIEKEMFSIVFAVQKFRPFGNKFTDHKPLKFLFKCEMK